MSFCLQLVHFNRSKATPPLFIDPGRNEEGLFLWIPSGSPPRKELRNPLPDPFNPSRTRPESSPDRAGEACTPVVYPMQKEAMNTKGDRSKYASQRNFRGLSELWILYGLGAKF